MIEELDHAIRKVSLGGKEMIRVADENGEVLAYEIELIYIK